MTDAYLTHEDWIEVQKRFKAGTKTLFCDLVEHEPVLAEALAIRSVQLTQTLAAQGLSPEVMQLLNIQAKQVLLETMMLMRVLHDRIMQDLLPGPDLRVSDANHNDTKKEES